MGLHFDAVRALSVVSVLAATAAACSASDRAPAAATNGDAGPPIVASNETDAAGGGGEACAKMDILFVIDNSGSMKEEQVNLASNFSILTTKLDFATTSRGAKLDYRIAVTTTGLTHRFTMEPGAPFPTVPMDEVGDDGRFRKDCKMTRAWMERGDDSLQSQFACVTRVGTAGPGLEMPLEAMRLALTDRVTDGANAGFLRDDALLAVVFITDEDDCSRRDNDFTIKDDNCPPGTPGYIDVPDYVTALDQIKGGREKWAAAVVAGPVECTSGFGAAKEATRLKGFVGKAGKNALFSSICLGDLVSPLEEALNLFNTACQNFKVK